MEWVYAGSKHEARNFLKQLPQPTSPKYKILNSVTRLVGWAEYEHAAIHIVGTAYYRKDIDHLFEMANRYKIPLVDHTTHGVVTAPSMEIAHVFHKPLGISAEWRHKGTQ